MKRIKRIFCLSLVIVSALVLCACSKDYNSITYKRFTEKMGNELNYAITDNTLSYEGIYEREYTAIKEDIIFIFYEFSDKESAKEYVKSNYSKLKYYSYSDKGDYSIVKSSKAGYFKLIQVDNIVISGYSDNSGNKSSINKAFNKLGF